jgi:hypothetical protein
MKLTNTKIKRLIRESLKRILFESEDRIADLKDQFNLVYQKMSRAKSQEEFDQLNAEAEKLDKEINRLTRTMFKEPEDPGEFDFMETEPLQPPMLSRGTEVGAFQDDIDPLDQPAMIDVSDGEGNDFTGGPMTQRDMNRRDFLQNVGVGVGASALLGRQILDATSVDPRLKIASDWFDQSFADGTWDAMYDTYVKNWLENTTHNFGKDFDSSSYDEQVSYITDYIVDYSPEEWSEALTSEFENAGYQDPGETGEMDVYKQLSDLIYKKLQRYYTPEKIKELRSSEKTKTTTLTNDMIESATEGYVDEHFDYNGATEVISTGTLDDIELFENNQAVRCTVDFMDMEGLNLSTADANKLLNAIRAKVDKIMSRLGGP